MQHTTISRLFSTALVAVAVFATSCGGDENPDTGDDTSTSDPCIVDKCSPECGKFDCCETTKDCPGLDQCCGEDGICTDDPDECVDDTTDVPVCETSKDCQEGFCCKDGTCTGEGCLGLGDTCVGDGDCKSPFCCRDLDPEDDKPAECTALCGTVGEDCASNAECEGEGECCSDVTNKCTTDLSQCAAGGVCGPPSRCEEENGPAPAGQRWVGNQTTQDCALQCDIGFVRVENEDEDAPLECEEQVTACSSECPPENPECIPAVKCWNGEDCLTLADFVRAEGCDSGALVDACGEVACACRNDVECTDRRTECINAATKECIKIEDYAVECDARTQDPERDLGTGECVCGPKKCATDADCCPSYGCARTKTCVPTLTPCESDAQCNKSLGAVCDVLDGFGGGSSSYCQLGRPLNSGKCPVGKRPFAGYCIADLPCNGGCPSGQVCEPFKNTCIAAPEACTASCGAGEITVFTSIEGALDQDNYCPDLSCKCEAVPDILEGDSSLWSEIVVLGGVVYGTAYNQTYGDLVFVEFEAASPGQPKSVEYIDGVPAAGKLQGPPDGVRGGNNVPGPNVGQHTAIAAAGTTIHVSYYDVDKKALKYIARVDGVWGAPLTVDESGECGQYTSIVATATGPKISYYCQVDADGNSALKVAVGTVAAPTAASEFTITTIEAAAPVATTEDTPNEGIPQGVGIMTDIAARNDGRAVICYYDHRLVDAETYLGDLKLALENGDGTFTTVTVDAEGDTGRHCSVAIDGTGTIGVAYQNATMRTLNYWYGVNPPSGSFVPVDLGVVASVNSKGFVGGDASLVFEGNNPRIAYHQGRTNDLMWAVSNDGGATWQLPEVLNGTGQVEGRLGCGWFASAANEAGGTPFVADVCLGWNQNADGTFNGRSPNNLWSVRNP